MSKGVVKSKHINFLFKMSHLTNVKCQKKKTKKKIN